ncbi:transferase [Rhodococcoides trifolii]|uniref:Transferase n=1 Tax=Rhodococcoides trifolii TaxID=908250 RepID=A0A917CJG6_9NOCA|nr:NeuD/PglB/VioB family sugar acetyltransferase [Rhodococcus trifolii]GGF90384.1 transferase [Rhodococcus trifolii]
MTTRLVLVAASGLAREAAAAVPPGMQVVGCLDDDLEATSDVVILGTIDAAAQFDDCMFLVCAGSGAVRQSIVDRMGVGPERFATVVHPSVDIPAGCTLGSGCVVLAHSVLTADVTVGSHCVLMPHVTLTHDVVVGDFVTLCAGVSLGGGVAVGDGAYVGMNAAVRQGVRVGSDSLVGMGAVVLQGVPDGQTWVGSPAGPIRRPHSGVA